MRSKITARDQLNCQCLCCLRSITGPLWVEYLGRRRTILSGYVGMGVCMITFSATSSGLDGVAHSPLPEESSLPSCAVGLSCLEASLHRHSSWARPRCTPCAFEDMVRLSLLGSQILSPLPQASGPPTCSALSTAIWALMSAISRSALR